ncbi:MAG: efflux RND transporter periplasmic adaptor subunit [Patescibacteria group bacterium]
MFHAFLSRIRRFSRALWPWMKLHPWRSLVGIAGFLLFVSIVSGGEKESGDGLFAVQRGDIVQEVSVTGRVEAAEAVDLAFERSGRVTSIPVSVGNTVRAGQVLVRMDGGELIAQRQRELATVKASQAQLDQILAGKRTEDIDVLKTMLANAERTLTETKSSGTYSILSTAVQSALNSFETFTNVQYAYFAGSNVDAGPLADAKSTALHMLVGEGNLGRTQAWYFLSLTGGLRGQITAAQNSDDLTMYLEPVQRAGEATQRALQLMQGRLSSAADVTTTDRAAITTELDAVAAQLKLVSTQRQALVTAENAVRDARTRLTQGEAPAESFDVQVARAQLEQAQANLALVEAQLRKYTLVAPFAGTITSVDVERGQIVQPQTSAVSLISDARLEIEAAISEADIIKVQIGDVARVVLDAYGRDRQIAAHVVHIDPAAHVTESVATYRVTLQFDEQHDDILPGLTADLDIQTDARTGVLFVPTRDIITKEGVKLVRVRVMGDVPERFVPLTLFEKRDDAQIFEAPIETGLRGSDGRTEVLSGLMEGDVIVTD